VGQLTAHVKSTLIDLNPEMGTRRKIQGLMLKTCSKCKETKDLTAYHNSNRSADKKQHRCKECCKAFTQDATKTWRKSNIVEHKHSTRKTKVKVKYGLSLDIINKILEAQDYSCAICKRNISFQATEKRDKPHIDHCHKTNEVRGLLCLQCNTGIGMFGDSIELIEAAKTYLSLNQRERLSELTSNEDAIVRSHGNNNYERLAEMTSPTIH
jgi:hypothetical protein